MIRLIRVDLHLGTPARLVLLTFVVFSGECDSNREYTIRAFRVNFSEHEL